MSVETLSQRKAKWYLYFRNSLAWWMRKLSGVSYEWAYIGKRFWLFWLLFHQHFLYPYVSLLLRLRILQTFAGERYRSVVGCWCGSMAASLAIAGINSFGHEHLDSRNTTWLRGSMLLNSTLKCDYVENFTRLGNTWWCVTSSCLRQQMRISLSNAWIVWFAMKLSHQVDTSISMWLCP